MKKIWFVGVCMIALAGTGLAQVATPLKAKGIKGEFVTAYAPCTAPSMATSGPFAVAACPLVRSNPTCGFGPTGKGKYSIKLLGTDLKVGASLTGLEGCGSLFLVADFRMTVTDCAGPDCTTANLDGLLGSCSVVDGKCTIKTTFETFLGGGGTSFFKDGETYNIELGDVCVMEADTDKAFCGGIVLGVAQPGLTTTTSTTNTSTSTSTTTSTTPPCTPGVSVGGFCWYVGDPGASCDGACSAVSRVYDPATKSYAGSDGTDANCLAVHTALGGPGLFGGTVAYVGIGCFDTFGYPPSRDTVPTLSSAPAGTFRRVCACQ